MSKRPPKSAIWCEVCRKRKPYLGSRVVDFATATNPLAYPIAVCESCLIALGLKKPKRFYPKRAKGDDLGKPPWLLAKPYNP